jgi:four helix bundle protein
MSLLDPRSPAERFSFEDLEVWHEAVNFADECLRLAEDLEKAGRSRRLIDQFESSSVSPAQNIAEGKGRFSKEFVQFLYVARGSVFETLTLLNVFHRRRWLSDGEFAGTRADALQLARRISALINAVRSRH